MKKVLLLSAAVCMALTMSAQKLHTTETATFSVDKNLATPTYGKSYAQKVIAKTVQPKHAPAKEKAMPTVSSLTGLYICDNSEEGNGTQNYTRSANISMEQLEEIVIIEGGTEDEPFDYNCNVQINDLLFVGTRAYAVYDEEEGTLTIPVSQLIYQDEERNQYLVNVTADNGGNSFDVNYANPIILELDEDDNGFYFYNNEDETQSIGFAGLMTDAEGNPTSLSTTCTKDISLTPCNYYCDIEEQCMLGEDAKWEEVDPYGVFIEQVDVETFAIHGFMGLGVARVTIDEEGKGQMATLQPLLYTQFSAGDFDYLGAIKWTIKGENIEADANIPYIECGFFSFKLTDKATGEVTELPSGLALYDGENNEWEYYSPGRAGMTGGYAPLTVCTLYLPIEHPALNPDAIKTAIATRVKPSTFNLAGQRVKEAKGIVIENNKKVIR